MKLVACEIIPDSEANKISYSKNYRIISVTDPLSRVQGIGNITDDVDLASNELQYVSKYFRYSYDQRNWSLWYSYMTDAQYRIVYNGMHDPPVNGLEVIKSLMMDAAQELFMQFKFEYDDTTSDQLAERISVNKVTVTLEADDSFKLSQIRPKISCGEEQCPMVVATRDHSFQPYEVGSAVGIYKDLSFYVNRMFGHDVIYFRTLPKDDSGDYIFKEWNLYNVVEKKCIKIIVDQNEFPDNKLIFNKLGVDYEVPFEVQVDKRYFESMFNAHAEPRKRDFLYFPMLNRMFEIQGSYAYRSLMMEPVYYKVQLVMYRPNINMIIDDASKQFLDNILLNAEDLFEQEVQDEVDDATNPQQMKTISKRFDETRGFLASSLDIRTANFFFNYDSLIEYYYNMGTVGYDEDAVVYKVKPALNEEHKNFAYSCLFNVPTSAAVNIDFIKGLNDAEDDGMRFSGTYNGVTRELIMDVQLGPDTYNITVPGINTANWYALMLSVSLEFKQIGINVYEMTVDSYDGQNHNDFVSKYNETQILADTSTFSVDKEYRLVGSDVYLANIRLYNRIVPAEEHAFVMSQLFIKDESMLYIIDNNRPKLNVPFISRVR